MSSQYEDWNSKKFGRVITEENAKAIVQDYIIDVEESIENNKEEYEKFIGDDENEIF